MGATMKTASATGGVRMANCADIRITSARWWGSTPNRGAIGAATGTSMIMIGDALEGKAQQDDDQHDPDQEHLGRADERLEHAGQAAGGSC